VLGSGISFMTTTAGPRHVPINNASSPVRSASSSAETALSLAPRTQSRSKTPFSMNVRIANCCWNLILSVGLLQRHGSGLSLTLNLMRIVVSAGVSMCSKSCHAASRHRTCVALSPVSLAFASCSMIRRRSCNAAILIMVLRTNTTTP
jgi:hypothetical protein